MDLADLGATMIARRVALYFLAGAVLFVAERFWTRLGAPTPEVVVRVPSNASEQQVATAVEESLLLEEARRRGWDVTDPIVASHLVQTMQFVEPHLVADDSSALTRAIELRMHERDPVVRARLLYRARRALATVPRAEMPALQELRAHLAAHPERFRRPARVRIEHVFLSRTRRGQQLDTDGAAVLRSLRAGREMKIVGDPLPDLRRHELTTVADLSQRFGASLSNAVANANDNQWLNPVSSLYGLHLLRVVERLPARVPPLDFIIDEVREDRLRELSREIREARLKALRAAYSVRLEHLP